MAIELTDPPSIMSVSSGEVRIVTGHALDLIEQVDSFDLLVTDPPYAFGNQGTTEHAVSATVATVLRESAKRLRKGGWAVVFAASSWRSTAYMIEATRGVLEPVRFGTWAKPAARSKVRTPGWSWASVNVILLRRPGKNPPGEPVSALDYIVEPPVINGRRAELPEAVARWAVEPFVSDCGLALDPFAGTGQLLKPAAAAGMAALGFDQDETASVTGVAHCARCKGPYHGSNECQVADVATIIGIDPDMTGDETSTEYVARRRA